MGRKCLLFPLIIVISLAIPGVTYGGWLRTFGGERSDRGRCVQQTSDGGYIVVGYTDSFVDPDGDVWLLKFNDAGDTVWTKVYGDTGADYPYCVKQTTDGGYVIASSFGLIKTDDEGEMQWTKPYPARYVDITDDGGYVLGGPSARLVKMNSAGDTVWTKEFEEDLNSYISCVRQTSDGGYIVTGHQTEIGSICNLYWIDYIWCFKTDSVGNKLWENIYLGENSSNGYSACEAQDGSYYFAGIHVWDAASVYHLFLAKTNSSGDVEWDYTAQEDDMANYLAYCVSPTTDGGCVVTGEHWYSFMKLDSQGTIKWTRTYFLRGRSIQQTKDGGYIATGFNGGDLVLLKTNANGDTLGIAEEPPVAPVTHSSNWLVLTLVGEHIVLQYFDMPQGLHAEVFDAAGCKVDDICAAGSSGIISWGDGYGSGVYFIRVSDVTDKGTARIVLIR